MHYCHLDENIMPGHKHLLQSLWKGSLNAAHLRTRRDDTSLHQQAAPLLPSVGPASMTPPLLVTSRPAVAVVTEPLERTPEVLNTIEPPAIARIPAVLKTSFSHRIDQFLRTYIPGFTLLVDFIIKPLLNLFILLGTAGFVRHYFRPVSTNDGINASSLDHPPSENDTPFPQYSRPILHRTTATSSLSAASETSPGIAPRLSA